MDFVTVTRRHYGKIKRELYCANFPGKMLSSRLDVNFFRNFDLFEERKKDVVCRGEAIVRTFGHDEELESCCA